MSQSENSSMHKCTFCPYSATRIYHLQKHTKTHLSETSFKFPEQKGSFKSKWQKTVKTHVEKSHLLKSPTGSRCSRRFPCSHLGCSYAAKRKWDLKTHSKIHSGEKSFSCTHPNCNYSTKNKASLRCHTRTHTGEKPYKCQFESCSYALATLQQLGSHLRIHTKERPYKCPEPNCEYSAVHSGHLKEHQLTHSPNDNEERPSFKCPLCEYSTQRKGSLSAHIKTHTLEKFFKCDELNCKYEARTKTQANRHKRLKHSDEKPFACSVKSCEYRGKTKGDLSNHLKTHCAERQYKCQLCPFRGKQRTAVTAHITNMHADPDSQLFRCTEPRCDYGTKQKGALNLHLLIHKGEKKHACSFPGCDYRAVLKSYVKHHEANFHGDKKDKCRLCDFKCKTKYALTSHVRIHTKKTPFICHQEGCGYQAKTASTLRRHEKTNHPQIV